MQRALRSKSSSQESFDKENQPDDQATKQSMQQGKIANKKRDRSALGNRNGCVNTIAAYFKRAPKEAPVADVSQHSTSPKSKKQKLASAPGNRQQQNRQQNSSNNVLQAKKLNSLESDTVTKPQQGDHSRGCNTETKQAKRQGLQRTTKRNQNKKSAQQPEPVVCVDLVSEGSSCQESELQGDAEGVHSQATQQNQNCENNDKIITDIESSAKLDNAQQGKAARSSSQPGSAVSQQLNPQNPKHMASNEATHAGNETKQPKQVRLTDTSSDDDGSEEDADWCVDQELQKQELKAKEHRLAQEKVQAVSDLTAAQASAKQSKLENLLQSTENYSAHLAQFIQTDTSLSDHFFTHTQSPKPTQRSKQSRGNVPVVSNDGLTPLIKHQLKDYQIKGVRWLLTLFCNGLNGILGDQMGLGKTVQTIAFLACLRSKQVSGPFLIVAPLSTLPNWEEECAKWCPSLTCVLYHGTPQVRAQRYKELNKDPTNTVVLTSYEMLMFDVSILANKQWKFLVVDEGHRLKNQHCRLLKDLAKLRVENKLLLTGTPLQNSIQELFSLLHFLHPEQFGDQDALRDSLGLFDVQQAQWQQILITQERQDEVVSRLQSILQPLLLRRLKQDVELSIPKKQEIVLFAEQTELQKAMTYYLLSKRAQPTTLPPPPSTPWSPGEAYVSMTNPLMQLRKVANHPYLIQGHIDKDPFYPSADVLREQCGKLKLLEKLLTKLRKQNRKVLVFSQMTSVLDIIDTFLEQTGVDALRLDGSVPIDQRRTDINRFKTDSDAWVYLLSTRAGGQGINLTSADTVVLYDSDWNPQQDLQAQDRCHRVGQTQPVLVFRLCTVNTVEVAMLRQAQSKLALERVIIQQGRYEGDCTKMSKLTEVELSALLEHDLTLSDSTSSKPCTDDQLDLLLLRDHLFNTSHTKPTNNKQHKGKRSIGTSGKRPEGAGAVSPYPKTGVGYEVVPMLSDKLAGMIKCDGGQE